MGAGQFSITSFCSLNLKRNVTFHSYTLIYPKISKPLLAKIVPTGVPTIDRVNEAHEDITHVNSFVHHFRVIVDVLYGAVALHIFNKVTHNHDGFNGRRRERDSTFPFAEQFGFSKQEHFCAGVDFDLGASELGQENLVARFDTTRHDFSLVVDGAGADGDHRCVVDLEFVGETGLDKLPSEIYISSFDLNGNSQQSYLFVRLWQNDSSFCFRLGGNP